jgi:hypothetical protein
MQCALGCGMLGVLLILLPAGINAHTTSTGLATLTVTGATLTYQLLLLPAELPQEPAQLWRWRCWR